MEISPQMEILAIALTFFVHLIGAGILVWNLMDSDEREPGSWRDWWPRDDRGPEPPVAPVGPSGDGALTPVLPDAAPSPVRLREPGRIGDRHTPTRRPAHPAVPARPVPEREEV